MMFRVERRVSGLGTSGKFAVGCNAVHAASIPETTNQSVPAVFGGMLLTSFGIKQ
jgi:hypothetical protein